LTDGAKGLTIASKLKLKRVDSERVGSPDTYTQEVYDSLWLISIDRSARDKLDEYFGHQ
jgi:hypothetical protein